MVKPKHWLLFALIPLVAIAVAGRQLYLSKVHNLSTWKGGGMGMFASADLAQRHIRIFVELPGQPRIIVNDMTPELNAMVKGVEIFPSDDNFDKLGQRLRRTRFRAVQEPAQIWNFDQSGNSLGRADRFYLVAKAESELVEDTDQGWQVVIEFSELSYDLNTKLLKSAITKSRRYGAIETAPMTPKL